MKGEKSDIKSHQGVREGFAPVSSHLYKTLQMNKNLTLSSNWNETLIAD